MHALITKVELPEGGTMEEGRQQLERDVFPQLKSAPGFKTAYFLAPPEGREGLSFVIFEEEAQARHAADHMDPPPPVKLVSVEVREVAASL
ncbi:MAG: hypothetical protein ABR541_08705 [Candidatus Dormibacteria bacterium]